MDDTGPWGRRDGNEAATSSLAPATNKRRYGGPLNSAAPKDKGRVWLIVSTLLMVGFLWLLTQSWVIAVSLMFALFVHEYGHVLAMNRLGMGPAKIYVIPFLGGLAKGTREPKSEWIGVLVSLAGPAFGLLAMLPLVGVWLFTGSREWMGAAFFVAMLNLINLLPAPPLDGSRALGPVLARVHPKLEKLVLLLIGVLAVGWGVMSGRYVLAIFLALAIWGHMTRGGLRTFDQPLSWGEARRALGLFLLTAIACGGAAMASLLALTGGDVVAGLELVARYIGLDR